MDGMIGVRAVHGQMAKGVIIQLTTVQRMFRCYVDELLEFSVNSIVLTLYVQSGVHTTQWKQTSTVPWLTTKLRTHGNRTKDVRQTLYGSNSKQL